MQVECICQQCGSHFRAKPSQIARGRGKFCSRACTGLGRRGKSFLRDLPSGPARRALADRFWTKVVCDLLTGCWCWTAALRNGYGAVSTGGSYGPTRLAHDVAWSMASGQPIPDGKCVLHTCDNRRCVRNDGPCGTYEVRGVLYPRYGHLVLATRRANTHDMMAKGRARFRGSRTQAVNSFTPP